MGKLPTFDRAVRRIRMDPFGSPSDLVLMTSLLLLLSMLLARRQQKGQAARLRTEERLDTIHAWPATLVPAMTPQHSLAYELLRQAMPGCMVLVHVPLAQFIRVSTRNSYAEWYRRAGRLRASLLVCDRHAIPVAVVDLRCSTESERESARHLRVVRVLEALGMNVMVWTEERLPTVSEIRQRLAPLLEELARASARPRSINLALDMSGALEAQSVESTDFAALDSGPVPLDERSRAAVSAGRRQRLA